MRDAWGRERWIRADALGRMVEVVEPNPGGDGTVASNGLVTQYTYDALDNLTLIEQGSQTRRFRRDGLNRLTHQKLAEREATLDDNGQYVGSSGQWSDLFSYDTRSNLIRRVDARGVKINFIFNSDPLNRLQAVQYDKSGAPASLIGNIFDSPNVSYTYMTSGNKMRVGNVNVDNGMGNQSFSYDSEGRLGRVSQTFAGRESYPLIKSMFFSSENVEQTFQFALHYILHLYCTIVVV